MRVRFYYHEPGPYESRVYEIVFGELNSVNTDEQPEWCASMSWYKLKVGPPSPRLEIYHDTFWAIADMEDILTLLSEHERSADLSPDDFVVILRQLGFKELDWSKLPPEELPLAYKQFLEEAAAS